MSMSIFLVNKLPDQAFRLRTQSYMWYACGLGEVVVWRRGRHHKEAISCGRRQLSKILSGGDTPNCGNELRAGDCGHTVARTYCAPSRQL